MSTNSNKWAPSSWTGGRFWRAQQARSLRACAVCSSGSTCLASGGARGSFAEEVSQTHSGGCGEGGGVIARQFRRRHKPGARKILVARGSRLPVPELLILDLRGGQFRNAFEAQNHVA